MSADPSAPNAGGAPGGPRPIPPPTPREEAALLAARAAASQARAEAFNRTHPSGMADPFAQFHAPIVPMVDPVMTVPVAHGGSGDSLLTARVSSKHQYKKRTKKYNNFNIFFMLERQLLLQSRGGGIDALNAPVEIKNLSLVKHKKLELPPLCKRYAHLPLTKDWFLELLANQNKKRPHRKSHGLIPFKELAQTVAKNYREIDDDTKTFVDEIAERLGWHCEEVEAIDAKLRKKKEEEDRKKGIVPKKQVKPKDAPIVSKGTKALSNEEAATVKHLMGMKGGPAGPPQMNPHLMHPAMMGRVPHMNPMVPHNPMFPHPAMGMGFPGHPMMGMRPPIPVAVPSASDIENTRLELEMARAMHDKVQSERKVHQVRDRMAIHQARSTGHAAAHHDHARAMMARGHGLAAPASPMRGSSAPNTAGMAQVEKELLRETLIRRLIPPTPGSTAAAAAAGEPSLAEVEARLAELEKSDGPPNKRTKYANDATAGALRAELQKREKEKEQLEREIAHYQVLRTAAPPGDSARAALYDSLARGGPSSAGGSGTGQYLGAPKTDDAVAKMVREAAARPEFAGLSHADILQVWNKMNAGKGGEGKR